MKKTVTIEVPDGLPDGWECCGYGKPVYGETMQHGSNGWSITTDSLWSHCHLIARRTETAADWANKQPNLGVLAGMLYSGTRLCLDKDGAHEFQSFSVSAEPCSRNHDGKFIQAQSGKWTNA